MPSTDMDNWWGSTEDPLGASRATDEADDEPIPATRIAICTFLFVVVIVTIAGNAIVMIAFIIEKRLRSTFNIYIFNLALTDFLVALSAMSFYTFDVLLGYWPFGQVLCGIWIFFDYGMTFASVFTLVAISLDRLWSVVWSLHYRTHNTTRKTMYIIVVVWVAVFAVWLAPCVSDRIKWSEPGVCKWEPSKNGEFVVFVAVIGHHIPCILLITCYIRVYMAMRRRTHRIRNVLKPDTTTTLHGNSLTVDATTCEVSIDTASPIGENELALPPTSNPKKKEKKVKAVSAQDKERKIFVTLSYIIFTYLACWVPFHVVFDMSAIDPDTVPETAFTFTFWLTYFNSTLNPFLYAYTSKDFRKAFKRVVQCKFK